jgi:integrase
MRLLILLGQRSAETAGMQWSEVALDGDASTWTIPAARAKTGNKVPGPHILPLPRAAVNILSSVPRMHKNPYVFWGRTENKPVHADQGNTVKTLRRHCDAIVKAEGIKGVFAETWSAHDLRRTLATGMARLSIDQHLADLVIHHHVGSLSTVAKVYQQYKFEREARAALEKWAKHVVDLGSAT